MGRHGVIRYAKPTALAKALALLGDGRWRVLAGGTDIYPAQGARPFRDDILDINGLSATSMPATISPGLGPFVPASPARASRTCVATFSPMDKTRNARTKDMYQFGKAFRGLTLTPISLVY